MANPFAVPLNQITDGISNIAAGRREVAEGRRRAARSRENLEGYNDAREEYESRVKELDWEPTYKADLLTPYKRTESPAARAYLESMLTGNNPAVAATPWSNNVDQVKAKHSFENTYGTNEQLLAAGKKARADGYEVKTPEPVDTFAIDMEWDEPEKDGDDAPDGMFADAKKRGERVKSIKESRAKGGKK